MLDIPANLDVISIAKPTNEGVPTERLQDPSRALQIVSTLIYADQDRCYADTEVKGMLDGNAPFNNAALVREGQGQRTNVNFLEGDAILDAGKTPYYDLFAESSTYFQIEVNKGNAYDRAQWSRTITSEFDALLKEWVGFDWNIQMMLHDLIGFGTGYCMWPNNTNWQFETIRRRRVLVPDGTPSDPDRLELLVIRQSLTVSDLYKPIRNEKAAESIGWDVTATLNACARAMPEYRDQTHEFDYDWAQQQIRNHDIYESVRSDVIKIAHVLVKEFDGRITHLIVEERDGTRQTTSGGSTESAMDVHPKFLYKKVGRFACFRECIATFFYDVGDGTWHSVKGLAKKLYPFIEIKNRLNCALVDNTFLGLSVLVQPTTSNSNQSASLMHIGPVSVLPAGFSIQQWGLSGRIDECLTVERSLSDRLESNIGSYRRPLSPKTGNPDTATEVQIDAAKEASLSKGAVNRFYSQLDNLGCEMYRRASNPNLTDDNNGPNSLALEFQRRCLDAGVPKDALIKPKFVRATRSAGNGSMFLRQQVVLMTAQYVPMMNESGRQNWLDDAISVLAGSENVSRWNPKQTMDPNLQNEAATATLENAAIKDGSPVMHTETQNDLVHSLVHLKAGMASLPTLKQGADPTKVAVFLEGLTQHIAVHLHGLSKDSRRKQETKMIESQLKQLVQASEQLKAQLQKSMAQNQQAMQQAQQNTGRVMNEAQIAQFEARHKAQLADMKTRHAMQLKDAKANQGSVRASQDMAIKDAQAATQIDIANKKALAEARRKSKP